MKELDQVEKRLAQAASALEEAMVSSEPDEEKPASEPKPPGSNRGVETMFRNIYRVQMDLTGLADNKANMMISINGIIISIIIAAVAPKLDNNPWLMLPTTILLLGTMFSLIFSIMAAKPRINPGPLSLQDLRHSQGNLLFFGNFARISEREFIEGMSGLMEDRATLYESMMRDIHGLGSVLNKKFRLLQHAYLLFMVALVAGVVAYIAVFAWVVAQT